MSVRDRLNVGLKRETGTCASCSKPDVLVISFQFLAGEQFGNADPLCTPCLEALSENGFASDVPLHDLVQEKVHRGKMMKKRKKRSVRQELEVAELLGGRRQPNSGATPHAKGDIRTKGLFRGETKFTENESFSLKYEELEKIRGECSGAEKPIFVIDFLERGTRKLKERYAVILGDDLKEFVDGAGKHR